MNTKHQFASKTTLLKGTAAFAVCALALAGSRFQYAHAEAEVGQPAPSISLADTNGRTRTLAEFKGKFVVLEWLNHGCPFVKKHYDSGNMQKLQKSARKQGVVWLSIVSSAPGKQGASSGTELNKVTKGLHAKPSAVLIDRSGTVGRAYGAKTTPHMFVINPQGKIVYNGAIDDKPSTDTADIKTAHNYVMTALKQARSGKNITTAVTQPYGCSVKY